MIQAQKPTHEASPPARLRKAESLAKLSRSPTIERTVIKNYYNQSVAKLEAVSNYPGLSAFLPQHLWPWVWSYLKYAFSHKVTFPTYAAHGSDNGVYRIEPAAQAQSISLAIAGDWATGTQEAWTIAKLMSESNPDFTIHLGDVYYVGDEAEIGENCLGRPANGYDGVEWPKGSQGSFALNGNHEMYAKGRPYFHTFLPRLGMNGKSGGQLASYFCLETQAWRIIAIDTGYNSIGIPLLSMIPLIREIPFIGGDCHLEQDVIDWLRDVVEVKSKPKPTLLLGHHNHLSAFSEQVYTKPGRQLAELFKGQEFVWIWGHEHRLGIYNRFQTPEGLAFYGRCVGNGGMPIEIKHPDTSQAPLAFYDPRSQKLPDHSKVGINGFVKASLEGDALKLDYFDIDNTLLLSEEFRPGPQGQLSYQFNDPGVLKKPHAPSGAP